jgi:hypothetical protein
MFYLTSPPLRYITDDWAVVYSTEKDTSRATIEKYVKQSMKLQAEDNQDPNYGCTFFIMPLRTVGKDPLPEQLEKLGCKLFLCIVLNLLTCFTKYTKILA